MNKSLIIVDVQKDFYHPEGALYVKGAEVLPERIEKIIPLFKNVIFTLDYHPYNHCSFKEYGGIWPEHCIEHTEGAALPKELLKNGIPRGMVYKGQEIHKEEYGADANAIMIAHNENPEECEFVFCGIHALYCVKETIKNFIEKYPQVKVSVLTDCIAPLDCDEFNTFCIENGITQKSIADF